MSKKVLVLDTSIFCVWLEIPSFERCGGDDDYWDRERTNRKIEEEIEQGTTFVLPLATIIETGNHLSQSRGDRYDLARRFCSILAQSVNNESPWAAYSEQGELWDDAQMRRLAEEWPELAVSGLSIGDATIKYVADWYAKAGYEVEILTGDSGLKAYEPSIPLPIPRRRKG